MSAKSEAMVTENDTMDDKASLLRRVAAWWASDDSHQLVEKDSEDYDENESIHIDFKKFAIEKWTKQRVKILEILWGVGTRLPGDDEFNQELFNLVPLNSKSKILDISAGLGSCSRLLAKNHFAHVDVIESTPNLLPHLVEAIKKAKQEPFISILDGDLNEVEIPRTKYDLIYGREALFKVKNKQAVLEKVVDGLNTNGHLIFTDFVLEKDASSYKIFKNWSEREKATVYPVSVTAYKNIINGFDMKLKPVVDYSEDYIRHVNVGWLRLKEYLEIHEFDNKFVNVMAQESDLWLSRVRALRSGKLKLVKFHATF